MLCNNTFTFDRTKLWYVKYICKQTNEEQKLLVSKMVKSENNKIKNTFSH